MKGVTSNRPTGEGLHIAFRNRWWIRNGLPYTHYDTIYCILLCCFMCMLFMCVCVCLLFVYFCLLYNMYYHLSVKISNHIISHHQTHFVENNGYSNHIIELYYEKNYKVWFLLQFLQCMLWSTTCSSTLVF